MHEFVISNDDDRRLKIESIDSTCGCTVATPEATEIDPGDAIVVPVLFRVGSQAGLRSQRVRLRFSGGEPDRFLTVAATVRAPLTITPAQYTSTLLPGEQQSFDFTVENYTAAAWTHIESGPAWDTDAEWLEIGEMQPVSGLEGTTSAPRQRWIGSVKIMPRGLTPGTHSCALRIAARGTDGRLFEADLPIDVAVRPHIRVVPQRVLFTRNHAQRELTRPILFQFADESRTVDADAIRISHDLPCEINLQGAVRTGTLIEAQLSVSSVSNPETIRGAIEFQVGTGDDERVSISIVIPGDDLPEKPTGPGPMSPVTGPQ